MFLKEFAIKLGLDVDAVSFAQGQIAVTALSAAISMIRSTVGGLSDVIFGFNANAEKVKLQLATIASMNLKLPWEQAKAASEELFAGLQEDAAKTPAETGELVEFATNISSAYFRAGKNMKDLRDFTTRAVVAAKSLNMEGIAALDIQQALGQNVGIRDRFAKTVIEGAGSTTAKFNALDVKKRVEFLTGAFNSPAITNAMKEFESNWAGVTSTLSDNAKIIGGAAGKPIFDFTKGVLKDLGDWVQAHRKDITDFFGTFVKVLFAVGRVVKAVVGTIAMLIEWFYKAGPVMGTINTALAALVVALMIFGATSVTAALTSAAAWVLAALPIIAIAALVGIALLLIEDIYTGLTGGKSVVFELWEQWKKFMSSWLEDKDSDPWWLSMIKQFLLFIFDTDKAWAKVVIAWQQVFSDFVEWVENLFADLWKGIKTAAADALDAINPFSAANNSGPVFGQVLGSSYTPKSSAPVTISPSTHIGSLNIQTTGEPNDVASKVRKAIDEHHETVMRETKAALAGDH
jgi:hypothetical protein